ncbi:trypsin-like peptidase domain-containing protein, partial [bacterium]|nr:trypsin-like peptidase domain-containing protein [bacterium]
MKVWRELLLGFLLGAVVFLGYREYRRSTAWVTQQTPAQQEQTQFDPASLEPGSDATGLTDEINQHRGNAITRTIQEVSPAVVGINVTQVREYRTRNPLWDDPFFRELFPQRIYRKNVENLGSGFLISPNGLVITNEHVVHNATEILITMTSGEEFEALIIGADYYSDIALLKINGENLPYARMGDSDDVIIGEWSIALGNPFGLFSYNDQPTATVGVVSATNRDFNRTSEGRIYKDMIQTDAAINRGNSGGALVNSLGDVIGMSTLIFSEGGGSLGIGFAIPINRIKEIVQELQATGAVNRNYWTGLSIQNLDRLIALSMKLPTTDGVIVTDIEPLSPGEKGGFQVADVI